MLKRRIDKMYIIVSSHFAAKTVEWCYPDEFFKLPVQQITPENDQFCNCDGVYA